MKKKIIAEKINPYEKVKKESLITKVVTFRLPFDAYTALLESAKTKQYSVTDYILTLLNEAHKSSKKSDDIKKKEVELNHQKKEIIDLKKNYSELRSSYYTTFGMFMKILLDTNVVSKENIKEFISELESECDSGSVVACSVINDTKELMAQAKIRAQARLKR